MKTVFAILLAFLPFSLFAKEVRSLLNVSYDPTREFYSAYNKAFGEYWKKKTGDEVRIEQSHGGSGKQARAVIDGLKADVVTLALAYDIDMLHEKGNLIAADWQKRLPNNSCPYTSTIVFLVRKGNPKGVKDWSDLVREKIEVITPNPKTSGGARWNFLAAWAYALKKNNGDEARAKEFVAKLYQNVPVLDSGARGSTITFAQRGIGDVLLSWENEAFLAMRQFPNDFEIVVPSLSVLTEPPVALVDKDVDANGNRQLATEYLEFLYSDVGQDLAGKNFYRPFSQKAFAKYAKQFPKLELVTIDNEFGGWKKAQEKFFSDGGIFDQIYHR